MNLSLKLPKIDLETLPKQQKQLLLIVLPLLITALVGYFVCYPLYEDMVKLEQETTKQQKEIDSAKVKAANLPKVKAEYTKVQAELKELEKQLPEEKEVSGLLKKVSELGTKAELQVLKWKPKDKTLHQSKEVYEIPVEVELRGQYHSFGQFYSNVTKLERIVNVSDINMANAGIKARPNELKLSCLITTYSVLTDKEREEIKKKEKEEKEKKEKK
ncbi:MAG: type 4a pilus biogenesis protein PilO [Thermodesulfovibrionales bacterium]|nr:type 4a pilus biogenesis protein PilO [Thermodesulfovibrionales bacterium]